MRNQPDDEDLLPGEDVHQAIDARFWIGVSEELLTFVGALQRTRTPGGDDRVDLDEITSRYRARIAYWTRILEETEK